MSKYSLGICEWSFPLTGPAGIRIMPRYGIREVQLDLGPYETGLPLSVPEIQQEYLIASKDSGISLQSICCSDLGLFGTTNSPESSKGQIAREIITAGIYAAEAMGVPSVMLTNFRDGLVRDEDGYRNVCETFKWACALASDHGVHIISESAMSCDQILRLFDFVKDDSLSICFDTQNPWIRWGYYVPDMVYKLEDLISFIHIKDGKDGVISSCLIGEGDSSFDQSVQAIRDIGYSGTIMFENLYNKKPLSDRGNPFLLLQKDVELYHKYFPDT